MKRAGFTMIELIFVIVILGILAAVALPKFAGVSDQANAQKCNAFVGTLNRTVGPSMWSESISDDLNGSISAASIVLTDYIAADDIPTTCGATTSNIKPSSGDTNVSMTSVTFGSSTYVITKTDGNISSSPRWEWNKTAG